MTAVLYLLNVACSSGGSALSKQHAIKGGTAAAFNINKAIAGISFFLIYGLVQGISLHLPTLAYGIGYGVFLCISMDTGFKALAIGPMALTSIIASFSLIIPFIFGIFVWNETMTAFTMLGMVFLFSAIILLNFRKEGGISLKWSIYAIATMLANGVSSLIQKYHQINYPGIYRTEFMLSALICVLLILTVRSVSAREKRPFSLSPLGLSAGLLDGAANYIVLYLAATEKASVLFPLLSVSKVLAVWCIGRIAFKEHLKPLQLVGLAAGIVAILLLNL